MKYATLFFFTYSLLLFSSCGGSTTCYCTLYDVYEGDTVHTQSVSMKIRRPAPHMCDKWQDDISRYYQPGQGELHKECSITTAR